MEFQNIIVSQEGVIQTITINRPKQLNALNKQTIEELSEAFKGAEANAEVRVVIVTGSGDKAFVAGADIKEFANFNVEQGAELSQKGHDTLFNLVENLKTPVIAAVNGFALGGGLELAISAHIRVCSSNAKMGLPEVSLGVIPGYGGTQRLPQLIGKGRANELVFSAQMIDGKKAEAIGLVNYCVEPEALMETATKLAAKIAKNSPSAIGFAIEAINAGFEHGVNGFQAEVDAFGKSFGTEDFKEGTTAFVEKRKPSFTGK